VAVATLSDPARHAGRAYAPTGPEALTFAEVAQSISIAAGRNVTYRDIDRQEWLTMMTQSGVSAEYGAVLRMLTETIASGQGSRPNHDVFLATGTTPKSFSEFASTASLWEQ